MDDDDLIPRLIEAIESIAAERDRNVIVAIDGRSGAGKSTLAAALADRLESCSVIGGDSFYAGGTPDYWDSLPAADKAARVMDWRRQRPVLEALAQGVEASWHGYDWQAFDGRLESTVTVCRPASVVMLEGVYSARPELADLLDLRVLLDTEPTLRRDRLRGREGDAYRDEWEARWSEAEDHYFGSVMPPASFDLVL